MIGDDGDVDGHLMTVDDWYWRRMMMHMPLTLFIYGAPFPGGRLDLIVGPKASDNRGFEKRQVGGWSHLGAVGQTVLLSDGKGVCF